MSYYLEYIPFSDSLKSFAGNCRDEIFPLAREWSGRAVCFLKDTALNYPNVTMLSANILLVKLLQKTNHFGANFITSLSFQTISPKNGVLAWNFIAISVSNYALYRLLNSNLILTALISSISFIAYAILLVLKGVKDTNTLKLVLFQNFKEFNPELQESIKTNLNFPKYLETAGEGISFDKFTHLSHNELLQLQKAIDNARVELVNAWNNKLTNLQDEERKKQFAGRVNSFTPVKDIVAVMNEFDLVVNLDGLD